MTIMGCQAWSVRMVTGSFFSAELVLVSGLFGVCGCNRLPSHMLRIVCLQLCGSGQGLPV